MDLIPPLLGALVAVFGVLFTFWKDRERAREEAHRERKIAIYGEFGDLIFEMLELAKAPDQRKQKKFDDQMNTRMMKVAKGVLFYGSPDLIQKFGSWMGSDNNPAVQLQKVGAIMLAMRSDIGMKNDGLDEMSIHQVYVNGDVKKIGITE